MPSDYAHIPLRAIRPGFTGRKPSGIPAATVGILRQAEKQAGLGRYAQLRISEEAFLERGARIFQRA
jgi:hypothetical protein